MDRYITTLVAALGLMTGTLSTYAVTNYWDNNSDTAGFGTAGGTWGTEPKWSSDSTGVSVPAVTSTTTSDDLHFGTASNGLATGTVTVEGTGQAFRSMTFGAASGPITLSGGTLNLAAPTANIHVNNTSNTIASMLAGTNASYTYSDQGMVYPGFLTKSSVTLFTNSVLSDYVAVSATMAGGTVATTPAVPCFFIHNGTNAIMQLQIRDGTWTKCVKIELTQSGPDIAGHAIYAKYSANPFGFDFDTGGNELTVATASDAPGYGITQLSLFATRILTLTSVNTYSGSTTIGNGTLEIGGEGQLGSGAYAAAIVNSGTLLYNSSADQSFSGPVSGAGSLVKESSAKHISTNTYPNFLTKTPTLVCVNARLSDCVGVNGIMAGVSISGGSTPGVPFYFTNNGTNITVQIQAVNGTHLKCVKIELTQVGRDIAGRAAYAKVLMYGSQTGFDFDTGGIALNVATSYITSDYGIAETTLTLYRDSKLTLSGTNSYAGGTVVNSGMLEATTTSFSLPTSGGIVVNNGGELMLNAGELPSANAGGVGNGNPITVNSGGVLTLAGYFNAGASRPITINGGTLNSTVSQSGDCANYINKLTLKNNAQIIGYKLRVGLNDAASIVVSGTSASSLAAGISMVKLAGTPPITFNVADVTGDAAPDLAIPGVIRDYSPGLAGLSIVKTGAGTLSLSGINTLALTGTLGPKTLRFGTSDSALTSSQLSAITINNEKVRIKSDGYLAPGLKGTLILLQ